MDLWNNAIGRKYAEKLKSKKDLLKALQNALENGELIISPADRRIYEGASHTQLDPNRPVIVLGETNFGRNETFYDLTKKTVLTREEFVALIKSGSYLGYSVKQINGVATPVSKPDNSGVDNLG